MYGGGGVRTVLRTILLREWLHHPHTHTHTGTAPVSLIIRKYELQYCDWSWSFMCSLTTILPTQRVSRLSWFFMLQCLLESRRCYKARVFAVRCQHFQKMENLHRELDNIWGRDRTLPWWLRIRKVKWWVAYKPRLTSTITITSFMYLTWNQFLFEFTHLYNFILFYIMYYSWHVLYLTYCFYCGFVEC